jgi:heat-inducible transcriptional repressor
MMLDERKLEVLKAIVTDYVAYQEPVGSKGLVERHNLDVSPATVRNDMAVLEEEGYLTQPHTSAGRIPTDKGYRLFVDRLATVKPLSVAERRAIVQFMDGAVDLDDIVHRTVKLLAQITHQVAIMAYPMVSSSQLRHVELISMSASRVLLIIVTNNGRIVQRTFELPDHSDEEIDAQQDWVNQLVDGKEPADVMDALSRALDAKPVGERQRLVPLVSTMLEAIATDPSARVAVAGVPNLTRFGAEYETTVKPVLEALEEQVVLLQLLGESATQQTGNVTVRIGQENPFANFRSTSVVASTYGSDAASSLGVVGPTRMDYPSTMAAVRSVARYVGRFLAEG